MGYIQLPYQWIILIILSYILLYLISPEIIDLGCNVIVIIFTLVSFFVLYYAYYTRSYLQQDRVILYICIFLDLRDYLSPINPLSRLSHPIHLRCIGSYLSLFLYPFTSSFSLLILYLPSHFLYLHPRSQISGGFIFCLIYSLYSLYLYFLSIPPLHCKGVNLIPPYL